MSSAEKAVDGNTNPDMADLSCVHPDTSGLPEPEKNQPAWWRVDLGADYDVYEVIIVNRDQFQGTSST